MSTYQTFIGLEIHIHLAANTKVFCGCKAHFGDEPNTNVCPVCMGLPGTLPQLNAEAIRKGYAVAKMLKCELTEKSIFERKNYFYPDMPKNYQISQFASPLGTNGSIEIEVGGKRKKVRIHECHLEEDAGKMIHAGDMSLLDYNRAGYPLLEIVTDPDLERPEEAEELLHELRRIVRAMGVSDGNMEEGSLRCDANISLNTPGAGLGRKVEIKNLNSSRFVRKSILFEIARQSEMLDKGQRIVQETRLWNENRDQTESMRNKESAHDYRFFPEPDLPPFHADADFLASIEGLQTELPIDRRARFVTNYGLPMAQAEFLCEERGTADYFEAVVKAGADATTVATWLSGDVQKLLNRSGDAVEKSPLTVDRFVQLMKALAGGRIHGKLAKQILELVFSENKDPELIIKEQGFEQVSDTAALEVAIEAVMAEQPKAVADYRGGDQKAIGFLIGQVMRKTGGRASPGALTEILQKKLGSGV